MKLVGVHLTFVIAAALCTVPAVAAVEQIQHPAVWAATYVTAYQPQFGTQGVPYSGLMKLKFNHGTVNGTYDSTSVRPDPYRGRILTVTGTISSDNHVMLRFGSFSVPNATIGGNGTIKGTANWQGRLYNFMAKIKSMP